MGHTHFEQLLLESIESLLFEHPLSVLLAKSQLLIIPVQLIGHVLVANSHASRLAYTGLLLIYILVHEIDELLVEEAVLVSVLEQ